MRPLIGIPCHAGTRAGTDRPIYYNNRSYIHAVERAGGIPVLIPVYHDLSGVHVLLSRLDGLLISGGIDVNPRNYQDDPHPMLSETNPPLDALEIALARWATHKQVPTLGICRGMQMLNVAAGGSLHQHLGDVPETLRHGNWDLPRNTIVHQVRIERGSRLEHILGVREVPVNSLHHQAVKRPGKNVYVSGYAEDGIAELLEIPDHPFMLGAQCHPEELCDSQPVWSRIFAAFIDACVQSMAHKIESVSPMGNDREMFESFAELNTNVA